MKKHKIDWRKGSATLIVIAMMCVMSVFMLILYMTIFNITYISSVAITRTDAIADSAAVYAQSYDYNYNKSQAEIMTELLRTYNSDSVTPLTYSAEINFVDNVGDRNRNSNTLIVTGRATGPALYPDLMKTKTLTAQSQTTVKSVDIWGDIFVVPDEIGNNRDTAEPTVDTSDADIVS